MPPFIIYITPHVILLTYRPRMSWTGLFA